MFRLCEHAKKQAAEKGMPESAILMAANDPSITYDNKLHPGQRRHIRGNLCAVVDPSRGLVVTVYENVTETALRKDQTDKAALRYARNRRARSLAHA